MPSRGDSDTRRRPRLRRERVIASAVGLADEAGLDALSMRTLADRLGVKAMSLYNHVANKDDLIDGMVDAVYAEIAVPAEADDWRSAIRQRTISAREVLARHPWAIALMESRPRPGPANLHHHDTVLGLLRAAGFSLPDAVFAFSLVDSFLYGFALQEASLPFATPDEMAAVSAGIVALIPADQFPNMRAAAVELPAEGYRFGEQFETGLDLVLDGIERWQATR